MSGASAVVAVIAFAVLVVVFGGFAFLYYVMALSTGLLDVAHFCIVLAAFAATLKMPSVPAYLLSALLGLILLFPLSLFLYVSNGGVVQFAGLDGAASIVGSPFFPFWLILYSIAIGVAQLAARTLLAFARHAKKDA
jgi:hypothetical protein